MPKIGKKSSDKWYLMLSFNLVVYTKVWFLTKITMIIRIVETFTLNRYFYFLFYFGLNLLSLCAVALKLLRS